MATPGDTRTRTRIAPPRTSIPRYADSLNERLGPAALSFMLHALVIALLLWRSAPLVSDFMQGQLGGGGGGGNDGSETQLISLSSPVQSVAVAPVVPTPPVAVTPTPDAIPQPKPDTVTTPVTTTAAAVTSLTTTAVSGDVGAAALGAGGGAGGGSGTGNGPGNGVGNGPGSGPGSGNGTGGGGNSLDGLIPPSPIGMYLPPIAPKALKGKLITVLITVDPEGRVLDAQLDKSTGDNKYDKTLRNSAMSWRFRPARTRNGEAVKSTMPVTYLL